MLELEGEAGSVIGLNLLSGVDKHAEIIMGGSKVLDHAHLEENYLKNNYS